MRPSPPSSPPEQQFPYGWRYVKRVLPDGSVDFDRVPLTLEDCLHPQEGDVLLENTTHDKDCRYLADVFESRPLSPGFSFVSRDMGVLWGVAGIGHHSPDVAVFTGLSSDPRPTALLNLKAYNGRCEFVVEVVSPSTRDNDVVKKFDHYHRVGLPFYVIIDEERDGEPRTIRAYRYTPAQFVEVASDARGRVLLPAVGLLLGMRDGRAVCFDAATGEEIEEGSVQIQQRAAEREQFRQFKEETDQTITEQIDAMKKAEKEADKQRQEADKQRQEADKQRQAREAAEERERQAAQRIRDLEAQLLRLQAGGDPASPPAQP